MSSKIKQYFNDYFDSSVWTNHTREFQISDLERAFEAGFDKGVTIGYGDGYDEGFDYGLGQQQL